MRWTTEWNDIQNIYRFLKRCEGKSLRDRRKEYDKLLEEQDLIFGSDFGKEILFAYKVSVFSGEDTAETDKLQRAMLKDIRLISEILVQARRRDIDFWQNLYREITVNKKLELESPAGESFIRTLREKIRMDKNGYQTIRADFERVEKEYRTVDFSDPEQSQKASAHIFRWDGKMFRTWLGRAYMKDIRKKYFMNYLQYSRKARRWSKVCTYIFTALMVAFVGISIYRRTHDADSLKNIQNERMRNVVNLQNWDYAPQGATESGTEPVSTQKITETQKQSTTETAPESSAQKSVENTKEASTQKSEQNTGDKAKTSEKTPKILKQYRDIAKKYKDFWGWIKIADTEINYPIMQSSDGEYYLKHDYKGNESREGSVFVDGNTNSTSLDNLFVVYGHNMKNGHIFGTLKYYLDKDYAKEHSVINVDSRYEQREYSVVAVLKSRIMYEDEEGYRYYQQYGYSNKEEFKEFKKFLKENKVFDLGDAPKYGDDILMLSTCEYSQDNGRLVIVGVRHK